MSAEAACQQKLKEVALVTVEMARTDVVVLRKETSDDLSAITNLGGIVCIYMGIRFIGVLEVAYIVFSCVVTTCKRLILG